MRAKAFAYWTCTLLLALSILSGGAAELAHLQGNVDGILLLGYPLYFLTILGLWKVLGAIAILVPGWPRLKEWAYAGIFFNVTGAAASHAAVGDYGVYAFHVVVNLVFAGLVIASWALRPESRIVGEVLAPRTRALAPMAGAPAR